MQVNVTQLSEELQSYYEKLNKIESIRNHCLREGFLKIEISFVKGEIQSINQEISEIEKENRNCESEGRAYRILNPDEAKRKQELEKKLIQLNSELANLESQGKLIH